MQCWPKRAVSAAWSREYGLCFQCTKRASGVEQSDLASTCVQVACRPQALTGRRMMI